MPGLLARLVFIFIGMMSIASADTCDENVVMYENTDHVYPFATYVGGPLQRFKGWMKNRTVQELDQSLAKFPVCGSESAIAEALLDGVIVNTSACRKLKPLMTCYQALGWPISKNPRKVAKVSEPAAPASETFESVRTRGGGAIMDFAAKQGCLSASTVRVDECRKYSAAAVPDLWRTLQCEQSPGQESCRNLLKLNDNLGPYRMNLPGALAVAQAGATKMATEPGPKPTSADKCQSVDAYAKPCVSVVSTLAVPAQATPGLIFYKIKFRMSDSCQGTRLVRATTSSGQRLESGISPGSETELGCQNQGQNACSGLSDPSSSC
jgi:hypothetical protein